MKSGGPHASIGFHLWHATLAWKSAVAKLLQPFELTPTQFFVLGAIGWTTKTAAHAPSQREIAELSGLDAMTTSQVVRALEAARLVRRTDDPEDSRRWRLQLTDTGKAALEAASAKVRELDQRFFGKLAVPRDQLLELFRALAERD